MRTKSNCNGNRRDKVALRTTCIKNVKSKIIKLRTGCQYVRYFATAKFKLDRTKPTTGPRVGHSWAKQTTIYYFAKILFLEHHSRDAVSKDPTQMLTPSTFTCVCARIPPASNNITV